MSYSGNTTTRTIAALPPAEDIPSANRVIKGIVLSVLISVSLIGNLSLWIVVLRSRVLRTLTSMFILGLSTADLLVATVNMPLTVYTIVMGEWNLGYNACVLAGFINMLTLIRHGLPPIEVQEHLYSVFTLSTFLSTFPLIGWSEYVYTPTHSFCFADWVNHMSYAFFMIGCCFGIPFSVMTVCNVCIIRTVRNSRLRVKTNFRNLSSSKDSYFRRTRNTTIRNDVSSMYEDRKAAGFMSSSFNLSGIQNMNSKGRMKSIAEQSRRNPRPLSEPNSKVFIKTGFSSPVAISLRAVSMRQRQPLRRREELRLALSLTVVVVVFVICWLPYCVSMLLSIFASGDIPREFHTFTLLIGYANSGCNPIIYGVMNERFKVGFKRLFCFWRQSSDFSIRSA
ncbi:OAR-like protein [Mya arenaria]|uniref:OAR-like protein n=1 Tax=Mya arenaria TaxID=6604 RepID=A0ABY7F7I4_MYAAR|nr:OAR-like protein [Mya arenaria]